MIAPGTRVFLVREGKAVRHGVVRAVETAHVLVEIEGESNPWGGPAREWHSRGAVEPRTLIGVDREGE